jgi:ATP-dependent Zn protease
VQATTSSAAPRSPGRWSSTGGSDTKRQRDQEQSQICDYAYSEATRLLEEHREALERLASKLLERETLDREDVATMLHDVERVGTLAFSRPGGPSGPAAGPGLI